MVMKILDWMHRRLHPVNDYSRVSHRQASAFEQDAGELSAAVHNSLRAAETEHDTEASLLLHVLDGILTIGTLGHAHPILHPDCFPEEEEEKEEVPKLETLEKELTAAEKTSARIILLQPATEMFEIKTEQSVLVVDLAEEKVMAEVPLLKEDMERKERTTLADLLAAEPASIGDKLNTVTGATKSVMTVLISPSASTLAVKCRGKENKKKSKGDYLDPSFNSSATKRIRRMLTRMVKKKIHPEAAVEPGVNGGGVAFVGVDALLLCHGSGDGEAA